MTSPPLDAREFEVREARIDEILVVRKGVLRPGEPLEPSDYDARPGVRHVGAFDRAGDPIGCATLFPAPYDGEAAAWQLRGMAVSPDWQGHGVGRSVLVAAVDLACASGAPMMWANARTAALGFYARLGWRAVGEEFTYGPASLPHYVIVRTLDAS